MKYMNLKLLRAIDDVMDAKSIEYAVEKSCTRVYTVRMFNQHGNFSERNVCVTININDDVNVAWPCITVVPTKGATEDECNAMMHDAGAEPVNPDEVGLADTNKALHYISDRLEMEYHCMGDMHRWLNDAICAGESLMSVASKIQRSLDKSSAKKAKTADETEDEE